MNARIRVLAALAAFVLALALALAIGRAHAAAPEGAVAEAVRIMRGGEDRAREHVPTVLRVSAESGATPAQALDMVRVVAGESSFRGANLCRVRANGSVTQECGWYQMTPVHRRECAKAGIVATVGDLAAETRCYVHRVQTVAAKVRAREWCDDHDAWGLALRWVGTGEPPGQTATRAVQTGTAERCWPTLTGDEVCRVLPVIERRPVRGRRCRVSKYHRRESRAAAR